MCGIAGYSLKVDARIDRTLAAQALLAGIAERGADAVGYAHRSHGEVVSVHKQRSGASAFLPELTVPASSMEVLLHVRDYTKGHPTIEANNHPVRHGHIVGVHNGIILNDEEIFERHAIQRVRAVDDGGHGGDLRARGALRAVGQDARTAPRLDGDGVGRRARAWRGLSRPRRRSSALDGRVPRRASSSPPRKHALEVSEQFLGLRLRKRELPEGTILTLEGGRLACKERFRPDRGFTEQPLPAVRAPGERESCLRLLTALASL